MLEVVYKTKSYVAILDTDDSTVEKIGLSDLAKLIKSSNLKIKGVEFVNGRLKVTSAERSLNENLKIQNGVLLGVKPCADNLTIRLSDWCFKVGVGGIDPRQTTLKNGQNFNRMTLIFDDNVKLIRGSLKNSGYYSYTPYVFDVREFTDVEPVYALFKGHVNEGIDFLREHIIDNPERFNLYVFALYMIDLDYNPIMREHGVTFRGYVELAKLAKPEYGTALYNVDFFRSMLYNHYEFTNRRFVSGDIRLREVSADKAVNYLTYRCAVLFSKYNKLSAYIAIFGNNVHPYFKKRWMQDISSLMSEHNVYGIEGSPESGDGLVNYVPDKTSIMRTTKALVVGGLDLAVADGTLQSVQIKNEETRTRVVLSQICRRVSDNAFNYLKKRNDNIVLAFDDSLDFSVDIFKNYGCNNFRIDISGISDDAVASAIYKAKGDSAYTVIDNPNRRVKILGRYILSHRLNGIDTIKDRSKVLNYFNSEELKYINNIASKTMTDIINFLRGLTSVDIIFKHNNRVYFNISNLKSLITNPDSYKLIYDLPLHTESMNSSKWHTCVNCYYLFSNSKTRSFNEAYTNALTYYLKQLFESAKKWYIDRGYPV